MSPFFFFLHSVVMAWKTENKGQIYYLHLHYLHLIFS